jgi:predicted ATPase
MIQSPHHSLVHQAGSHPHIFSQVVLHNVLFCLGFPDQAFAQSNASIAEARRLAHTPPLALSLSSGAPLHPLVGDDAALNERADELVAMTTEWGFAFWSALGALYRGWVNVKRGDVREGILLLRSGLSSYRVTTGAVLFLPFFIALLAKACEIAGQIEKAATLLDEALQIVDRTGKRWFAAELYRHKGQLLQRQGHSEVAEELYRKALSIALEQEAKLWELRAAVSLARLRRDRGLRTEARDLLAPIYGWFTEGFDTPDLREAKALLDRLTVGARCHANKIELYRSPGRGHTQKFTDSPPCQILPASASNRSASSACVVCCQFRTSARLFLGQSRDRARPSAPSQHLKRPQRHCHANGKCGYCILASGDVAGPSGDLDILLVHRIAISLQR